MRGSLVLLASVVVLLGVSAAGAKEDEKLGYPEPVLHWLVEPGETCAAVSQALYESAQHIDLIHRYNEVNCALPLPVARLLILPLEVSEVPVARLEDVTPVVRARPPEGAWATANRGMTFAEGSGVNTLAKASADLLFRDSSRIVLRENTLVVIYEGSAAATQRHPPGVSVAVDDGELRAAMASLQSRPVRVVTGEGSEVRVSSRDASVRHSGGRTAVSVFDGEARVSSAEEAVLVPAEHGTTFFDRAPPWKPKRLLPSPLWLRAPARMSSVRQEGAGPNSQQAFSLSWNSVTGAACYRVELSRDASFRRLVLQEEVPHTVRQIRLAGLPAGAFFLRVHAVDQDGLLGLPNVSRKLTVVSLSGHVVQSDEQRFSMSAYASLRINSGPGLSLLWNGSELLDEATFGPHAGRIPSSLTVVDAESEVQAIEFSQERPTVQLRAQWLPGRGNRVRLLANLGGRMWPGGAAKFGGLSPAMWETAGFRWVVVQGMQRAQLTPTEYATQGWSAEVEVPTREPVLVAWEDAQGAVLAQAELDPRVPAAESLAAAPWEPFALRLPYAELPLHGVATATGATAGLQGGSDGGGSAGFITMFGQLSRRWSLAAEWASGVKGGLGQKDQGSITAYAADALDEHWHVGLHAGVRLPFFLDGSRVRGLSGVGLEGAWPGGWRLLTSLDWSAPLGEGGETEYSTTQYLLMAGWSSQRYPIRGYIGMQGRQSWTRAPERLHGSVYVGLETGTTWRGAVTTRLSPTSSHFGPHVAVQTTLSRRF